MGALLPSFHSADSITWAAHRATLSIVSGGLYPPSGRRRSRTSGLSLYWRWANLAQISWPTLTEVRMTHHPFSISSTKKPALSKTANSMAFSFSLKGTRSNTLLFPTPLRYLGQQFSLPREAIDSGAASAASRLPARRKKSHSARSGFGLAVKKTKPRSVALFVLLFSCLFGRSQGGILSISGVLNYPFRIVTAVIKIGIYIP